MAEHRQEAARWAIETIERLGAEELLDVLRIEWSTRMRTSIGRAAYGPRRDGPTIARIVLNARLWTRASDQERYETVVHEVCHLVAMRRAEREGRKNPGHGPVWQGLMRQCGVEPKRCHAVEAADLRQSRKRYVAACGCRTHLVGPVRARRMGRTRMYRCRVCRKPLKLLGPVTGKPVVCSEEVSV
ncbi:MAG: SprT-like domain-containing protein [Myxococcota bacterium]